MKKISLDLEILSVESFATVAAPEAGVLEITGRCPTNYTCP
ncbi:MAG TPA: hypothetical protein VE871_20105 [Longimicrobium sp.]|nr:hypothetical protein [Longimicrobium sp.]